MMIEIDDCAKIGEDAAREAGTLLRDRYRTGFTVSRKGAIDLLTEVDLAAEELIVSRITKFFPSHSILAEERHPDDRAGDIKWIVDPLDGTTNYAHGYPVFAVSIGLEVKGDVAWGAVYDPMRDEMYTAFRGRGARCNGIPIMVSRTPALGSSLLVTGFPYDIRTSARNNLEDFCAFALCAQGIRRSGSAALDLCHVASGRLDGFWELKLNPWDCAAGYLMVKEAGGAVTDYSGRPGSIYDREVIASNGIIHDEMVAVVGRGQGRKQCRSESTATGQSPAPVETRPR